MTLGADPLARVLGVLRQAGESLAAADIKKALEHAGAERTDVDDAWPRVQKRLRQHPYVLVEGTRQSLTYRLAAPALPSPADALDALLASGLPTDARAIYADLVRDALRRSTAKDSAPRSQDGHTVPARGAVDAEEAGRRRQARIDSLRALAELAIEVEELVANEASAKALVQRVRGRVKRSGLEAIDRAGDETTYDRKRHKPIGGSIPNGSTVMVVRPGYVWKSDAGDVVLSKPVVEE